MTWVAIAAQLDYSDASHAHRRFRQLVHRYPAEDVETARRMECERLDTAARDMAEIAEGDHLGLHAVPESHRRGVARRWLPGRGRKHLPRLAVSNKESETR